MPPMTSSGVWAPTYIRPKPTRKTSTHGTTFQRPRRYGVTIAARPAMSTRWPDTNACPPVGASPRRLTSVSTEAGRRRTTRSFTTRSRTSFDTVTTTAASARRHRRRTAATIATTGPTTQVSQLHERPERVVEGPGQVVHQVEGVGLEPADLARAGDDAGDDQDGEAAGGEDPVGRAALEAGGVVAMAMPGWLAAAQRASSGQCW